MFLNNPYKKSDKTSKRQMKAIAAVVLCFTAFIAFVVLSFNRQEKQYIEFPAYAHPAAPQDMVDAVGRFLSKNGDNSGFSFRARKYSDDLFLIKVGTDKSEGWGLVAQKQVQDGQIYWQIDFGTNEKFESLGIEPQW